MAGEHPTDLTLLAYVEEELDTAARETVEAHLAECEACAADVRLARTGRDAARGAPLLEAPADLSGRVVGEITPPPRQRAATGRRWLGIVAPVAAALAIAGGIATLAVYTPGGGGDDSGADEGAAVAEEATRDAGGGELAPAPGETAPREEPLSGPVPFSRVAADPQELVQELRNKGFEARFAGAGVIVRTKRLHALRTALRDYPRGSLAVRVE
jgi:anti-sigma factor RsiW